MQHQKETSKSKVKKYWPTVCATPILVMRFVTGQFPFVNGVLLTIAIRYAPLNKGKNSENGNGVCRSLGAMSINTEKKQSQNKRYKTTLKT